MFFWFENKYGFTIFANLAHNYCHTFNPYYWKMYDFIQEQWVCRNIYLRSENKLILTKILSMHIALYELKLSINRDYKLESSWTMKIWEILKQTQQFKHSINAIFSQNNKQKENFVVFLLKIHENTKVNIFSSKMYFCAIKYEIKYKNVQNNMNLCKNTSLFSACAMTLQQTKSPWAPGAQGVPAEHQPDP